MLAPTLSLDIDKKNEEMIGTAEQVCKLFGCVCRRRQSLRLRCNSVCISIDTDAHSVHSRMKTTEPIRISKLSFLEKKRLKTL